MRGTISRTELRQVIAATYHQVWWPSTDQIRFEGEYLPVWYEARGGYLDPATGELLPTWDQALDAITDDDQSRHVVRFGARFDAQGVLAASRDSARCIGYLIKYLTKQLGDCRDGQRRPARTWNGSPRRSGSSRARRRARTGCDTASSRRTPGLVWSLAPARARPTVTTIWVMPGGGCWSRANGRARR